MWARVMSLPVPTIAALNGHAFAAGGVFALSHDHVLMREDRGFWCVNELLLRMRFTPGMQAMLSERLPV
jgi:Delta3-Delta2-enoyl-CoA isomerase